MNQQVLDHNIETSDKDAEIVENKSIVVIGNDTSGIEIVGIEPTTAAASEVVDGQPPPKELFWPEDIHHDAKGCGAGCWALRIWNNWTYSYMNDILKKGANNNRNLAKRNKKEKTATLNVVKDGTTEKDEHTNREKDDDNDKIHLTSDDLYQVPRHMQSSRLVRSFESEWEKKKSHIRNSQSSNKQESLSQVVRGNDEEDNLDLTIRRLLLKSLWKVAAPNFLPAGVSQLVSLVCISTMPLIVRRLLFVLEGGVDVVNLGLRWSLLLTFISFINGLAMQRYRHQSMKAGIALRSTIVNIVYKHVLSLSPGGKRGLMSGEINNLVAVDAQKLFEVTQEAHLVWALPLSVGLVTMFLCQVMGPSTLMGVFVLVTFLPVIKLVTKKMTEARAKRVKLSDERVEITVSMLMGMRTTKLNGYESKYMNRVDTVRNKELRFLAREQSWWASTLTMTVLSPVLATALTFVTYVLTSTGDSPNLLTAADTFGVLLLFGALRFPINYAGRLIGQAAQALSAIRRIVAFLERPLREPTLERNERDEDDIGETNDDEKAIFPLVLSAARFRVGVPAIQTETFEDNPYDLKSTTTTNQLENSTPLSSEKENHPPVVHQDEANTDITEDGGYRDNQTFTVAEFDFKLRKGEVLVVCGPVGSGKSTLLNGILGEAEEFPKAREPTYGSKFTHTKPMVKKGGRISYAPQDPFILNLSLRENILFGSNFDLERYNEVLDACALRPDIDQLGGSDLIQIGERGVTLSGGQRQRVSLARAVYNIEDLGCIILDDPFSALDSGTGKIVFERLIAAPNAILKDCAVLLVTHASHFISHKAVDRVLLMVSGKKEFLGTWEELVDFNNEEHDEQTRRAVDHIQSQVREETDDKEELTKMKGFSGENIPIENTKNSDSINAISKRSSDKDTSKKEPLDHPSTSDDEKIMQKELREHGLSSMKPWFLWFQRAGGVWFGISVVFLMAIDRFFYVAVEWFLANWTTGAHKPIEILGIEFSAQIDGISAQAQYLKVFLAINAIAVVATALRSQYLITGGVHATKKVFNSMLESVLRAPMSYFETVPMGRILNRFTYDTDVNDVALTQVISMFIISCSWYVATIAVQVSILPWSILALAPVSGMYLIFMNYYRMTGPDLQRIDALSRSPMQSMVSECLEGSTSIRVFCQDFNFVHRFENIVDVNSSALLNYVAVQRWLGVRMEMMGCLVVMTTSLLVVCLNDELQITAGLAGLLITWSSNFTITLNFLVQTFSETEAAITAIERVDAMADLPTESPMETPMELRPPPDWPSKGSLEFRNVSLRYREGLPLALNDLSFAIPAGKTCGIVGRTGAGKSSITVALFRLVEIEPGIGSIFLDGIDITKLGLSSVRGRGMSIIPQDPFLAGATLRECLDPFDQRTDSEIIDALESVRMGPSSSSTIGGSGPTSLLSFDDDRKNIDHVSPQTLLATKLEEGGSNYSVGERQLLNLARALLSQPRVLVLDEATASIDGETDAFIQKMLRTRFPETTLLTIAHRLNTIMDYDCILVMDAGRAAEFDSPGNLLENDDGIFSQLVDATGPESSIALRKLAIKSRDAKR